MIADNLPRIFRAGPEVSFRASPTVSPVTAFLWAYNSLECFAPRALDSKNFLALSHAPPELHKDTTSYSPETSAPERRPAVQFFPNKALATRSDKMARAPGAIISFKEESVEIAMQRL
eukprot:GHVT01069207.1.p1 GENE.GHVT01069207.1~~GHVT01069207.1.p1  ORF type:complete len:118 (-),score=8.52 GHVT01069207.1:142-495(-)